MSFEEMKGSGRMSDEQLDELARTVEAGEKAFVEERQRNQALMLRKQELQAQIDVSGKPRNDIVNVAASKELDDVEAALKDLDEDFRQASAQQANNFDDLNHEVKKRLH